MNEIREKLAKLRHEERKNNITWIPWDDLTPRKRSFYLRKADAILSLETDTHRIAVIKKGEPPLLTQDEMQKVIYSTPAREPGEDYSRLIEATSKAQRDSDIEYYK